MTGPDERPRDETGTGDTGDTGDGATDASPQPADGTRRPDGGPDDERRRGYVPL